MNFWKNKPLCVQTNVSVCTELSSRQELIRQVDESISASKFLLDYNVVNLEDVNVQTQMCEFVNKNYITSSSDITLHYSQGLFNYFCGQNNVAIAFYSKHKTMVGFIVGCKRCIVTRAQESGWRDHDSIEVNFLCLVEQLRSLHVSSHMISILSRECLKRFDTVNSAIYTIGKNINSPFFSAKTYYHRSLNTYKMVKTHLLSPDERHTRRMFHYKQPDIQVVHLKNINENTLMYIKEKIEEYETTHYDIFYRKSYAEMFHNECFNCFTIMSRDGDITDCVLMYRLDTASTQDINTFCKGGYLYSYFFSKDTISHKFNVLESIANYCKQHDIFDMITIMDPFGLTDKEYLDGKYIRGTGYLNYYYYNMNIYSIRPDKNGLVTI
jgi:N-myristoyl transferase